MNVKLFPAPWNTKELTQEAIDAIDIIADDIWRDASIEFYAVRAARLSAGKSAPKGMQRFLNEVLIRRFSDNDWFGDAGYFFKNRTWIRITFRHQMSLGSDILDAIKVCKKEGMEIAIILAANRETLKIVSPNDAAAMVSFEKLEREVMSLNGAIDIPLFIGELTPKTSASNDVSRELLRERPRDVYTPSKK